MKTKQLLMNKLTLVVILITILFGGCENPYDPDGGGGVKPDSIAKECSVMATVVKMPYGNSVLGDLWLKTDDGKFYLPCEKSYLTRCPEVVEAGDRVKFGYRNLPPSKDCLKDIPELKLMDAMPYQPVMLDCIQVISTKPISTCPEIVIDHTNYNANFLEIVESKLEGHLLKLTVRYGGCKKVESKDFSLSWKREISKSNPVQTTLQLYSAKVVEGIVCSALFTTDLCYDLTPMLKDVEHYGPINMHIGDKTLLLSK